MKSTIGVRPAHSPLAASLFPPRAWSSVNSTHAITLIALLLAGAAVAEPLAYAC
mgnify:CR=1 FL=1